MRNGTILLVLAILASSLALPVVPAQAASIIHVKPAGIGDGSSWDNAASLQDALTTGGLVTAFSGDEVWVAAGQYTPGTSRSHSFVLKDGVAVYGGFAGSEISRNQRDWYRNESILSGDIGTPGDMGDNSYHVVTGSGTGVTTILDGFTITGGHAENGYPDGFGGGLFIDEGAPTLTNVVISGNRANYGGGLFIDEGAPTLTNVVISGNRANYGGGMANTLSSPECVNVTVSGNQAQFGSGMYNDLSSSPVIRNSIIWGNGASDELQISNEDNSVPTYTYSLVQGLDPADTGNLDGTDPDTNPTFATAIPADNAPTTDGDYRLQEGSPVIDTGDNSAIPSGVTTDRAGNPRVMNGRVDLGAYEWQTETPVDTSPQTLLLVYAGADNDLADDTLRMFADLEASADNPHVTIIGMLDGPEPNDAAIYHIKHYPMAGFDPRQYNDDDVTPWSDDSADPEVLAEFINSSLLAYPDAEQVLLVVSGHGSGISAEAPNPRPTRGKTRPDDTLSGILLDMNPPGASLSTAEFGIALRDGLEDTGRTRLDGIYLDACLMGMIEVGYELRESANYLLVSSGLKWSVFAYQEHIAAIDGARDVQSILSQWLNTEREVLGAVPHTYSLLDLRKLEALRESLDELAAQLNPAVIRGIEATFDVYDQDGDFQLEPRQDSYVDLGNLLYTLAQQPQVLADSDLQDAIQTARIRLDAVVKSRAIRSGVSPTTPRFPWSWTTSASGLSIYAPFVTDQWQRGEYTADNFTFAMDGEWDEFLSAYWQQKAPEAPPACTGDQCGPWSPLSTNTQTQVWLPVIMR